jgi:hypothetical protein
MMAQSLVRSRDIALGGFYRRLAARRGGLVATKALARKLAAWFWRVMVKGDDYVEQGLARYEEQVRQSKDDCMAKANGPSARPDAAHALFACRTPPACGVRHERLPLRY